MLGSVVLALIFVAAGIAAVVRRIRPLRLRIKKLQASLAIIPIAQAADDMNRINISVNGLQMLTERMKNLLRKQ